MFSSDTQTWACAQVKCSSYGARLVVIRSEEDNAFITSHLKGSRTWIGMRRDEVNDESWKWEDGSQVVYKNFAAGEPNNSEQQTENCGMIYRSGEWNDIGATHSLNYICQKL